MSNCDKVIDFDEDIKKNQNNNKLRGFRDAFFKILCKLVTNKTHYGQPRIIF